MAREHAHVPYRWFVVVAAGLTIFVAQLDSTIVTVALPAIQDEFDVRPAVSQWIVLGYLVPLIAFSLLSGRWVDRVGRRSALMIGSVGFTVSSVAAAVAPGVATLIAARLVQGTAASVLLALAPVLAVTAVTEGERGRALAVVSTLAPLGAMAGPSLGGRLVDVAGWPWIFLVNVVVMAAVVVIGWVLLPAERQLRPPQPSWLGEAATLGGAAVALLLGMSLALSVEPRWGLLALATIPLVLGWTRSAVSRPVVRLFAVRGVALIHLAFVAIYTAVLLIQYITPYYLHGVLELPATLVGLVLLAYPAAAALMAPVTGILMDRHGPQLSMLAGAALTIVGSALLVPLGADWAPTGVAWRLAMFGLGIGLLLTPMQGAALAMAPDESMATIAASTNLVRHVGLALGPAIGTAIWAGAGYTSHGMRLGLAAACLATIGAGIVVAAASRSVKRHVT